MLKSLLSQGASNLQHLKGFGGFFPIMKVDQNILGAATLKYIELHELLVPFWTPIASLLLKDKSKVDGSLFRVFQA